MFGFGKTERAAKALNSALGIFMPANSKLRKQVLSTSESDRAAALKSIADGENPYRAGAFLVAAYIRGQIGTLDEDRKQALLIKIADENFNTPPASFRLAAHMVNSLAVLEDGKKPLIPTGSTYDFLDSVAQAFSGQPGARKHISHYLVELARHQATETQA